jgi:3-isopropylmalate dehydrogenase
MAMILSAAMMLDWLAIRHDIPAMAADGQRLRAAVEQVIAEGKTLTRDQGGTATTAEVASAVQTALAV